MNKSTLTNFSLEKPLLNNNHLKTVFPSSFSPQLEILGRVFVSFRLSPLLWFWNVLDLQHLISNIFIFIQLMSCDNSFKSNSPVIWIKEFNVLPMATERHVFSFQQKNKFSLLILVRFLFRVFSMLCMRVCPFFSGVRTVVLILNGSDMNI